MTQVNYLEFREKQLLDSKEIINNKKYHYTYRISTQCGKHYVGVRSCDCLPVDDLGHKYFGSPTGKESRVLTRNPENKFKILNTFPTRLLAALSESYYHHNLDVCHRSDFLNLGNGNVKGMNSVNYQDIGWKISKTKSMIQPSGVTNAQEGGAKAAKTKSIVQPNGLTIYQETGLKIKSIMSMIQPSGLTIYQENGKTLSRTISLVQPSGLTIAQETGLKVRKVKSLVQPSGLTVYQETGIKIAAALSVVQPSGLTIAQEVGLKSAKTMSMVQKNGLTIFQEIGLKSAKTRSKIQENGLTIDQDNGLRSFKTKLAIQPSGLNIHQEIGLKSAKTKSVIQPSGLTIFQEVTKTKSVIQPSGLTIFQEAGQKITGINHPNFKGLYVYNDQKWITRFAIGKALVFHNAYRKCKSDNLKIITSSSYMRTKFLQSLGTREEIVGQTWKDLGSGIWF